MKKATILLCIVSVILFCACSKSNERPAPVNCNGLITDTAGTNDTARIYAVTAFSPNNDGRNDLYRIFLKNISSFELKVYDENNTIVFTTTNQINGMSDPWNPVVSANTYTKYTYRIQATTSSNHKIGTCGNLYLTNCLPSNPGMSLFFFEDQLTQNGFTSPTAETPGTCN